MMKKITLGFAAAVLLASQSPVHANNCGWPEHEALASVVRVMSDDGSHASGVVVGPNRVLTAAHALDEHFQSYVLIGDSRNAASIALIDRSKDLAVLYVETGGIVPCLLYTSPSPRDRQKARMPSSA